jgi:hypothetical protein
MTITGEMCHRLLLNCEDILIKLKSVLLQDLGRLFGEDSIERCHAVNNHLNIIFACFHRWFDRVVHKEKMKGVAHNPAVAEGQNKVRLKTIKGEHAENPRKKARTDSKNERRQNVADGIKCDKYLQN